MFFFKKNIYIYIFNYSFYSQVDLRLILSIVPVPLSQGVLLTLLWQLARDISNNLPQKLAWMKVVANAIIPTDIGIAVNMNAILFEVYAILNHQNTLPTITSVELPIIRAPMNALNSMLMASE
jgi:enhancer of mRNA-decapping protein 4